MAQVDHVTDRTFVSFEAGHPACDTVLISTLRTDLSPRLDGQDEEHVLRLAQVEGEVPPVVVHRQTMGVIDGHHRVSAALLNGEKTIRAVFFDGSEDEAFIRSVELNIAHGLPLTMADRKAAARRILGIHPEYSDRKIARCAGLTGKTVTAIRCSLGDVPSIHSRVGQDGRHRPLDPAEGRRRAAEVIAADPDATLRQIARQAGISVSTAKEVRDAVRGGYPPGPGGRTPEGTTRADATALVTACIERLRRDPSVRLSESGRALLRWLSMDAAGFGHWHDMTEKVPPHCLETLAELAAHYSAQWHDVERQLRSRTAAF